MEQVLRHDLNSLITLVSASAAVAATAAGSGDNTPVVGSTVDRMDPATGSLAGSAVIGVAWTTALTSAKTLTIKTAKIEQSADASSWDATAYKTFADPGVVATASGSGVTTFPADLNSAKRYVRLDWTPDLSASGTDTMTAVAVCALAGFDRLAT